jgi:hypothetical protein
MKFFTYILGVLLFFTITSIIATSCAQIGMPTGGTKDTIPPMLVNASPQLKATNFNENKITLTFNEYIEVKDVQTNILVSPFPKKTPEVTYRLKTVTIKLKDTLQPNTTYSINFGKSIVDINESNPLDNFTYVFSTGATIDSLMLNGRIVMAQTGNVDSTYNILLYRNPTDSSIQKRKPDFLTKVNGKGEFNFYNLPKDNFKIYALKDEDGSKTYNALTEGFAFLSTSINTVANNDSVFLYAYTQEKEKPKLATPTKNNDKRLKYSLTSGNVQDLLSPLLIDFNKPLKKAELNKIVLIDTNYKPIANASITLDSTSQKMIVTAKWEEEKVYKLILDKDALADSTGLALAKSDTIKITAKKQSDYGNVVLRFKNVQANQNLVLQFIQNDEVKKAIPITTAEWRDKLFTPGDYELRVLYDNNKNGKWDAGNYTLKLQPERVITLSKKLNIRASWDNESDIEL